MACFVAPVVEAVVTTVAEKAIEHKEAKAELSVCEHEEKMHISFSKKLSWLNKMLWGGSALLLFEHIWHGEIIAEFPFFTAIKSGEILGMLKEIGTTGVAMAAVITAVWGVMVAASALIEKKAAQADEETKEA